MYKMYLVLGVLLAGLSVILGAFGAHGLKQIVQPDTLNSYQTGVHYQMYHALALILLGILYERFPNHFTSLAGVFFIGGTILFSGSLYLITSLKAMNKVIAPGIGILTPIGGLLLIGGWLLLLVGLLKK